MYVRAIIAVVVSVLTFATLGQSADLPSDDDRLDPAQMCIPDWQCYQSLPTESDRRPVAQSYSVAGDSSDCSLTFNLNLTHEVSASHLDTSSGIQEIYIGDPNTGQILRHDIDSVLSLTTTVLPINYGIVWTAADLDLDGNIDLVLQRGDGVNGFLDIQSAPTWTTRTRIVFPGMNVYFSAVAVNIDDDPYLEIHAIPRTLGGTARAVIIQYNPALDSFVVTDNIPAQAGSMGTSAIDDFDGDGRVEIVTGGDIGFSLYEYDSSLSYIGPIGSQLFGMNYDASALDLKGDGTRYLLTAHSSSSTGYVFEMFRPSGDNVFEVIHQFQINTGWHGVVTCPVADVDCDGRDEFILGAYPMFETWEWSDQLQNFTTRCSWNGETYGDFLSYQIVDLNRDGVSEWGTIDHNNRFQVFQDLFCATPSNGIVSWWSLDDLAGGISTDVWGSNDGAWIGNPTPTAGKVSMALSFDGIDDYVAVPDADSLNMGVGDFSVEAWVNTSSGIPVNSVVSKYNPTNDQGWSVSIAEGNRLQLTLGDGTALVSQSGTVPLADAQWHHIAVSVDRSVTNSVRFYEDGSPVGTGDLTGLIGSIDNNSDLLIGAAPVSVTDTAYFAGILDEAAIYRSALDSATIRCIYLADDRGKCPPDTTCNCPFQADYDESGDLDALDLNALIDVLFFSAAEVSDQFCPVSRGDVNADGFPDALDLNALIDHLFFSGPAPVDPCGP